MGEHPREEQRANNPSRIPEFRSREEEAEFWDTHDVTDYLDELRPVRVTPAPNLSAGMTVRLDPEDREALGRIAAERGIGPSTLVRMWIKERLRTER
jgi:predicted HicB family RNase H-like nuclease